MAIKIALSGKSGGGKTMIAEYLVEKHRFVHCSTGAACRELCRKLFGTESKSILNRVTDAIKAIDPDVWLRAALASVDEDRQVVFDSIRFASDYTFLQTRGFVIWRVEAPIEIRLRRMKTRGQIVSAEDDNHRAETELDNHRFDRIVNNFDDDPERLQQNIETALR